MADKSADVISRPMKYPYTHTARVVQFPWKFYFNNTWGYKYYAFGVLLSLPIFYKIQKLACSPENKAKWAEMKRREAAEHAHH